jgi:hypothetical protein
MEANLQASDPSLDDVVQFDVKGATFGDRKITAEASVLFNDGADMYMDTSKMSLVDPWKGVQKSLTMMVRYGKELRLLVCTERSGEHRLKQGPIEKSQDGTSYQQIVKPRPKPNDSKYQILAIVYGKKVVTEDSAYNYVYDCIRSNKAVKWTNDKFTDGWSGMAKTGTIYYTTDGTDVRISTGRENSESTFDN